MSFFRRVGSSPISRTMSPQTKKVCGDFFRLYVKCWGSAIKEEYKLRGVGYIVSSILYGAKQQNSAVVCFEKFNKSVFSETAQHLLNSQ